MKIAVLTNDYPPELRGGAGVIAEKQVEGLRERGAEVRVWHESAGWLKEGVAVRAVRHLLDIFPRSGLVKEVRDYAPDLLITHNLTGIGFGTPARICADSQTSWFHVLHDVQLFEPSGALVDDDVITIWQKFWSWLRQHTFGDPDLLISPTSWLIDAHKRRGWFERTKQEVLPNPGRPQDFVLRHPHEPFRLLFLGGASKAKGFEIIRSLRKNLSSYDFLVAGNTPSGVSSSGLTFYGRLNGDEVAELMKEADLLLVPSQISENQPTVILEAAAVGLPVVASDIGGIKETLDGAGVLCPPQDLQGWIDAIKKYRDSVFYQGQATAMFELSHRYRPKRHMDRLYYLCTEKRKTRT